MINAITRAISVVLNAEFAEKEYEVYMEEIKQDLKEPCFFNSCINPVNRLFFGQRYFRENQFCVQYFPESPGRRNAECYAVGERLFQCLEWLEVNGDSVMGTKMKYEVADGVLHFFVNYDMFVYKMAEPEQGMEGFLQQVSMKG